MNTLAATVRATLPADVVSRAANALDVGFERLVLERPLYEPCWQALRGTLPPDAIAALRLFLPYPRAVPVGEMAPFRMLVSSREERERFQRQAEHTLSTADAFRVPLVLLPTERFDPGDGDSGRPRGRDPLSPLMSFLAPLLERADRYDVTLCFTLTERDGETPGIAEIRACLEEFAGAPLAVWLDTARLPSPDRQADLESLEPLVRGITVQDVVDDRFGLVPGRGELDWETLIPHVKRAPIRALDLRAGATSDELKAGRILLDGLDQPEEPSSGLSATGLF